MIQHIQSLCMGIGDGACYALSLLKVAEKFTGHEIDVLNAIYNAIEKKIIKFNWGDPTDNISMYVDSPPEFLKMLTGRKWTVRREDASYSMYNVNEYVINSWGINDREGAMRHFTFGSDDTLFKSPLRTNGKLISVRVCKLEN